MTTLTATLTTTAMLITTLMLFELSHRSICQSQRWKLTVTKVGESLKDESRVLPFFSTCRGGLVSWTFKGRFHD
jgi:hypothetical protein